MTDQARTDGLSGEPSADEAGAADARGRKGRVSDGIKQGIGVLAALKDALEESIHEARERGDLSPDRAREVVKAAMARAQEAAGGARERLDLVSRKEFDQLAERVERLERGAPSGPALDGSG